MARMDEWRIDEDGSVRTPSGMRVCKVTSDGRIEVMDRVEHRVVWISLARLLQLWLVWRSKH